MDVFISWSGDRSRHLARLLHLWLPQVVNQLSPWMSDESISKGKLWSRELMGKLDATNQGIVCVTRANLGSPWLNFESGALAKAMGASAVRPLLLDVAPALLRDRPLGQFQATIATDKDDMLALMRSLNEACQPAINDRLLTTTFDNAWGQFDTRMQQILLTGERDAGEPQLDTDTALRELLQRVRQIHERLERPGPSRPTARSLPRIDLGG